MAELSPYQEVRVHAIRHFTQEAMYVFSVPEHLDSKESVLEFLEDVEAFSLNDPQRQTVPELNVSAKVDVQRVEKHVVVDTWEPLF